LFVDFDEEIGDLTSLETLEKHGIDLPTKETKGKQ
jgi:hypothetical protein